MKSASASANISDGSKQANGDNSAQQSAKHTSKLRIDFPAVLAALILAPACLLNASASLAVDQQAQSSISVADQPGVKEKLATIDHLARIANAGQDVPIQPGVIDQLTKALHESDGEVRLRAIDALNGIGTGAEDAIPHLIAILQDKSQPVDLRRHSVIAIRSIYAGLAFDPLNNSLKDSDRVIRSSAAGALGSIREEARNAVPQLISLVNEDPYSEVRASAAEVVGKIDPTNHTVWTTLNKALLDRSWRVRRSAADALSEIGDGAKLSVNNLLIALDNKNSTLRTSAAKTLGLLGPEASDAIPDLKKALLNEENSFAQGQAAGAIGNIGTEDPAVIDALVQAFEHKDPFVRNQAYEAFHKLTDRRTENILSKKTTDPKYLDETLSFVTKAEQATKTNQFNQQQRDSLQRTLRILQTKHAEKVLFGFSVENPYFWVLFSFLCLQFGIFWFFPLWLPQIHDGLKPYRLKIPGIGTEISATSLFFLKFRSRVLDAWVSAHIQAVQDEFRKIENVESRKIFIPSPATIDGRTVPAITNKDLDPLFHKPLLIWGEGGVGKTSLACQVAEWAMAANPAERICKHRMIPIFLEEDLGSEQNTNQEVLNNAILGQLKFLTQSESPISKELLENLLRRRRIMVIIDHLSEMNDATRMMIHPEDPAFPVNALVVTSRQKEILGQVNKVTIKPLRIMGNRLSSFMEAFLTKQGKRELFTDSEFFDACSHLSRMVGQREITAMLATLYARQMIAAKVEAAQDIQTTGSENIPDLMLSYLNQLNKELDESKAVENQFDDRTVHKDAMLLAWLCLKESFVPTVIQRESALVALRDIRGDQAELHLRYLEEKLLLIQTVGPSKVQLRFALDPLAEYLAALHLTTLYDGNEEQWLEFLNRAEAKSEDTTSMTGFMAAVQDCLMVKAKQTQIIPTIISRLVKLQNLPSATPSTVVENDPAGTIAHAGSL
jgi:HEAT repeat protein